MDSTFFLYSAVSGIVCIVSSTLRILSRRCFRAWGSTANPTIPVSVFSPRNSDALAFLSKDVSRCAAPRCIAAAKVTGQAGPAMPAQT